MRPTKDTQISFPSMPHVLKMMWDMIGRTNNRRNFHGLPLSKQTFMNCLLLGLYEIEDDAEVDVEELNRLGMLAYIVDRGATRLSNDYASDVAPKRKGRRVAPHDRDRPAPGIDLEEVEEAEVEGPRTPPKAKRMPSLNIPQSFLLLGEGGDEVDRAKGENKPAVDRRVP